MDLLVWSGGLDSTAIYLKLIYLEALKEYSYETNVFNFHTIYFEEISNKLKTRAEHKARKNILKILKSEGYQTPTDHVVKLNNYVSIHRPVLVQPLVWIHGLTMFNDIRKYDNVIFGYIKYDCFWHIKHDVEKLLEYSFRVLDHDGYKGPTLKFPFEWYSKQELYEKYFKDQPIGKKIFKEIWTCENPIVRNKKIVKCNKCQPCVNYNQIVQ